MWGGGGGGGPITFNPWWTTWWTIPFFLFSFLSFFPLSPASVSLPPGICTRDQRFLRCIQQREIKHGFWAQEAAPLVGPVMTCPQRWGFFFGPPSDATIRLTARLQLDRGGTGIPGTGIPGTERRDSAARRDGMGPTGERKNPQSFLSICICIGDGETDKEKMADCAKICITGADTSDRRRQDTSWNERGLRTMLLCLS